MDWHHDASRVGRRWRSALPPSAWKRLRVAVATEGCERARSVLSRCGGSRRIGTWPCVRCTRGTTPRGHIVTVEKLLSAWGLEKRCYFAPRRVTPSGAGGDSLTTASTREPEIVSRALTAPSFGTRAPSSVPSSFAKRMRLLMRSGLIAGITPTSIRRGSGQGCLELVFSLPVGDTSDIAGGVCERKAGC